MEVISLWFKCKNPDCGFIPYKTKRDKVKKAWRHGQSLQSISRQRLFMRYVEGMYLHIDNGDTLAFKCKYGTIIIYDEYDKHETNHFINPIKDAELCNVCLQRIENERALFQ